LLVCFGGFFILAAKAAFEKPSLETDDILVLATFTPFVLILAPSSVYLLIQPIISYLQLSPNGIKYRKGLAYGFRCNWNDVESLGVYQSLGILPRDVLYVEKVEPLRWVIISNIQQKLELGKHIVPLTGFQGWPEGNLADDLKQYVPHLFE
jgi:hypothetical protein